MNLALEGEVGERINRWIPVLIKVLAVAWAAWVLAGLAWLASGHDRSALPPVAAQAMPARPQVVVDTSRLASLDFFGQAKVADSGAGANAPDTTLQLKLNGVFVSGDPKDSSAIVSEAAQPAGKLYRINDSLPGGPTLAAVYEDRIMLKRGDGSTEALRFEKTSLLSGGAPPPPVPPVDTNGPPNVRNMLDQAAASLAQSPDAYLQEMGLVRTGRGYEVSPNASDKMLKASGLQAGDKIVSINGQALGNLPRDRELLLDLKTRGSARIEIQRGNQTLTIDQKF